jgi:hypothetical protein
MANVTNLEPTCNQLRSGKKFNENRSVTNVTNYFLIIAWRG